MLGVVDHNAVSVGGIDVAGAQQCSGQQCRFEERRDRGRHSGGQLLFFLEVMHADSLEKQCEPFACFEGQGI
ncbi:hypothetical protein D3C80_1924360 [compost metagenome]